jgi:hypothetical protein
MHIRSVTSEAYLYYALKDYQDHFTEFEQRFLVNMLAAHRQDQSITQKQCDWLGVLLQRAKIIHEMQNT